MHRCDIRLVVAGWPVAGIYQSIAQNKIEDQHDLVENRRVLRSSNQRIAGGYGLMLRDNYMIFSDFLR